MKALGILLVVIGLAALALPAINFTRKEKALDLGPVEVVTEKKETLSLSPLLGVSALATGAAILVAGIITGKK